MNIVLFQSFLVLYVECGLYKKIGNRIEINKKIKEDMKKVEEENQKFEDVIKSRKEKENIYCPVVKKMPCGGFDNDEEHYPVLLCEYCDHKFTEASTPGFC